MDKSLIKGLISDCEAVFPHLLNSLKTHHDLVRPPPSIQLSIRDSMDFDAQVRVIPEIQIIVAEVNTGTLASIYDSIEDQQDLLLLALFEPEESYEVTTNGPIEWILTCLYDVSVQFVLLHELFHVYCGHLDSRFDDFGNKNGQDFSLSENRLCISNTGSSSKYSKLDYFLEMEADGSALEWMLGYIHLGAFDKLLTRKSHRVSSKQIVDLEGGDKIVAFRVLLLASVVVTELMESHREKGTTHPLPFGRFLAALNTLMEWFAKLSISDSTDQENGWYHISDTQRSDLIQFINLVVKPVLRRLSVNGFGSTRQSGLPPIFNAEPLVEISKDLNNSLQGNAANTDAGRQLKLIESVRKDMQLKLKRYRHMEAMITL